MTTNEEVTPEAVQPDAVQSDSAQPEGVQPDSAQPEPVESAAVKAKKKEDKPMKEVINELIVLMRKDVNRAQIWLTNKMAKDIPKFREKKGPDAAKYHRRSERLVEELQVMKKMNSDEVTKYALCSKLSLAELTKQMDKFTIEQRVLAKLAGHQHVQAKVKAFYEKHKVTKDRVILLIRALGVRSAKVNEKKDKEKIQKQIKEVKAKKNPEGREGKKVRVRKSDIINKLTPGVTIPKSKKTETTKAVNSEGGDSVAAAIEEGSSEVENEDDSEVDRGSDEDDLEQPSGLFVRAPSDSCSDADDQIGSDSEGSEAENDEDFQRKLNLLKSTIVDEEPEKDVEAKSSGKKKLDWKAMPLRNVDRSEGTLTVKRLNMDKMDSDTIDVSVSSNQAKSGEEVKHVIPADAFFLGADVVEEPEPQDNYEHNGRFPPKRNFHANEDRGRPRKFDKVESSFVQFGGRGGVQPIANGRGGGRGGRFEKRADIRPAPKPAAAPVDESLHPSWVAKRKQKELSLESFQGKKIKFDDD